jgi:hypothetical protein
MPRRRWGAEEDFGLGVMRNFQFILMQRVASCRSGLPRVGRYILGPASKAAERILLEVNSWVWRRMPQWIPSQSH